MLIFHFLLMFLLFLEPVVINSSNYASSNIEKAHISIDRVKSAPTLINVENDKTISLTLEFEGFSPQEVSKFAAYYREYSGFKSEQVMSQTSSVTILLYTSHASKELILNNLQKTADINGFNVLMRSVDNRVHVRLLSKTENSLNYREW